MIDEDLMKTRPPAILVAAHEPCTNAVTITPPIYFSNYVYTLAATVPFFSPKKCDGFPYIYNA